MKFEEFFLKSDEEIQFSLQSDMTNGTLHEDLRTFKIAPRRILRMINVSDEDFLENQKTHFIFNNFLENCVAYEIRRKNML